MLDSLLFLAPVAMADPGGGAGGPGGMLGSPLFLIAMIAVMFYFLLYKPEQKKKQERENLLKNLQKGDEVMTAGGIFGKITAVTDQNLTLEISPGVRIKVGRQFVTSVTNPSEDKADKPKGEGANGKK